MKKLRKVSVFTMLMLAMLISAVISPESVNAQSDINKTVTKKNEKFTVETEYGMDGFLEYETPVLASVTIESKEDFVGTLRIIPDMGEYTSEVVAYAKDISLAAGESKNYNIVLSAINSYGTIRVEILNEKNKVVYGEKSQVTIEGSGSRIMVGVLSDDYSSLSYLDTIPYSVAGEQYMTGILELTKDSFPEHAGVLNSLQYIVIDNFDTSQLSDKQYEALKKWTANGGVLILGLGSNYQNVLNCFQDDFVSGTIGELKTRNVTWKSPESEKSDTETQNEETTESTAWELAEVECLEFVLNDGEEVVDYAEGGLVYQKNVGKGKAVVLAFALGMEPLVSFEGRDEIVYSLMKNTWISAIEDSLNGENRDSFSYYGGQSLAGLADENAKPNTLLYAVILILYAVLVGPILYVILRAVKKREKIWIAVPIVALIFTGVIYLTGFIYRINKPLVNTFSLITLNENVASEKIYTTVTCPKAEEYTVNINEQYSDFKSSTNYYDYGMFYSGSDGEYDYMVKEGSRGTELTINSDEAFEETIFSLNRSGDNNIGMLDLDLHCYTTGFEGKVTNNTCYDLSGVVVAFEHNAYLIEELKKGETAVIDSKNLVYLSGYAAVSSVYEKYKDLFTNRERYIQYRVTNTLENYILNEERYQSGCVWACIGSYKPDMIVDTKVKQSGLGVIYQEFEAEYEDVTGAYYPSIDSMVLSMDGDYDEYDRMIYGTEVQVTYSFEDYPGITSLTKLSEISAEEAQERWMQYAEVHAFNPETGNYEQIFVDSQTISGEELKKYISDDILILKYTPASGNGYSTYMPVISAKGDE